jgi:hypothetical protein
LWLHPLVPARKEWTKRSDCEITPQVPYVLARIEKKKRKKQLKSCCKCTLVLAQKEEEIENKATGECSANVHLFLLAKKKEKREKIRQLWNHSASFHLLLLAKKKERKRSSCEISSQVSTRSCLQR